MSTTVGTWAEMSHDELLDEVARLRKALGEAQAAQASMSNALTAARSKRCGCDPDAAYYDAHFRRQHEETIKKHRFIATQALDEGLPVPKGAEAWAAAARFDTMERALRQIAEGAS